MGVGLSACWKVGCAQEQQTCQPWWMAAHCPEGSVATGLSIFSVRVWAGGHLLRKARRAAQERPPPSHATPKAGLGLNFQVDRVVPSSTSRPVSSPKRTLSSFLLPPWDPGAPSGAGDREVCGGQILPPGTGPSVLSGVWKRRGSGVSGRCWATHSGGREELGECGDCSGGRRQRLGKGEQLVGEPRAIRPVPRGQGLWAPQAGWG